MSKLCLKASSSPSNNEVLIAKDVLLAKDHVPVYSDILYTNFLTTQSARVCLASD